MTNEEYFNALNEKIESLRELRKQGITLAKGIIGENLTKDDLFFCASLDRCLHLMDGFTIMLRERNLTCAGPILRLQMDNCMRTYAAFIAEDKMAVVDCLIQGTPIKNLRDDTGKKMTDGHLKEVLADVDPPFSQLYDQASAYIHLSEKAFYQTVTDIDDDGMLTLQVGHQLPEKRNDPLLECADAFTHFVILHYKMLNSVSESKVRFDAAMAENMNSIQKEGGVL